MSNFYILIAVIGLVIAIFGTMFIYNEVKDQLQEVDEIIDRFKNRKNK